MYQVQSVARGVNRFPVSETRNQDWDKLVKRLVKCGRKTTVDNAFRDGMRVLKQSELWGSHFTDPSTSTENKFWQDVPAMSREEADAELDKLQQAIDQRSQQVESVPEAHRTFYETDELATMPPVAQIQHMVEMCESPFELKPYSFGSTRFKVPVPISPMRQRSVATKIFRKETRKWLHMPNTVAKHLQVLRDAPDYSPMYTWKMVATKEALSHRGNAQFRYMVTKNKKAKTKKSRGR
ncbi:MAG: hypothetical protein MHM6MM_005620 [Cercozoa sp. M6MM]